MKLIGLVSILSPALLLLFGAFSSTALPIHYADFASPSGLIFQGDATLHGNAVRLTPSHEDFRGRVGGLWLDGKKAVRTGFETTFAFRISDKVRHGADGFAFVLQNSKAPSLGLSGHHLGYSRNGDAFAVVFDTYHWHRHRFVRYDEIAVTSSGKNDKPGGVGNPLGSITSPAMFSDGKVHWARLRYQPGRLEIFLDDFSKAALVVNVRLEEFISLDGDLSWVGFTSSTGADSQNHDILSWSFGLPGETSAPAALTAPSRNEPIQNAAASNAKISPRNPNHTSGAGSTGIAQPSTPTVHVAQLTTEPNNSNGANTTPGSVRMRLPPSVTLNHEVYASEDLVNWTPVTNLVFYFSDPSGTNYDRRFYTFREKGRE